MTWGQYVVMWDLFYSQFHLQKLEDGSGSNTTQVSSVAVASSSSPSLQAATTNSLGTQGNGANGTQAAGGEGQKCLGCGATSTPEWRRGPMGPRTLCNACGLVYAKMVSTFFSQHQISFHTFSRSKNEIDNRDKIVTTIMATVTAPLPAVARPKLPRQTPQTQRQQPLLQTPQPPLR